MTPNKLALSFVVFATCSGLALEIIVSDARRTEMSAAVFTGTVTNVQHLPLVRSDTPVRGFGGSRLQDRGFWRAEVVIETITKQDVPLGKIAVVYYEQGPIGLDGRATFGGRVCPGYPTIDTNMSATFWCRRVTIEGQTNVLYVSMPSWVKSK